MYREKALKKDITDFININCEIDETMSKGFFVSLETIYDDFKFNSVCFEYGENKGLKTIIKMIIAESEYIERGFKRIEGINKRVLKNIRMV